MLVSRRTPGAAVCESARTNKTTELWAKLEPGRSQPHKSALFWQEYCTLALTSANWGNLLFLKAPRLLRLRSSHAWSWSSDSHNDWLDGGRESFIIILTRLTFWFRKRLVVSRSNSEP